MTISVTLFHRITFSVLLTFGLSSFVFAQTTDHSVRIDSGTKIGGGYIIANGPQCFVVTAKHVILDELEEPNDKIMVTNRAGIKRSARPDRLSEQYDLALYRIDNPQSFQCAHNWNDGANARRAIETAERVFVLKTSSSGSQTRIFHDYAGNDGESFFKMYPSRPNLRAQTGDSGSPVFAGVNQIVGIAISVDSATGDIIVINQKTIDSQFASSLVNDKTVRVLTSQVTHKGRGEWRGATLSLMDVLEAYGAIAYERDEQYKGSKSWNGNIDPRYSGKRHLPSIPRADYLLQVDIIALETTSRNVKKYKQGSGENIERELGNAFGDALIGGLFGKNEAKKQAQKRNRDYQNKINEKIRIVDVSVDLEFRLTSTVTGQTIRHRETRQGTINTSDYNHAKNLAINSAIQSGTKSILTKAGL